MSKRLKRRSAQASRKTLQRAQRSAQQGDLSKAIDLLENYLRKQPNNIEALDHLGELYATLQNNPGMWNVVRRLLILEPDEPYHYVNAVNACMANQLPFSAWGYADTYLRRWPQGEFARDIGESKALLDEACAKIMADDKTTQGAQHADLALLEETQMLLSQGYHDEAREVVLRAIERLPQALAPRNNLSLIEGMAGHLDEAVEATKQVLNIDPENLQARCNLVNFKLRLGRLEEAVEIIAELRETEPEHPLELMKLIETFAYLGEYEVIVDLYERYQAMLFVEDAVQAMTLHLAATAYARLDKLKQAKSLWKKTLSIHPGLELARANLEDLKRPAGQQSGAWAFSVRYWLPTLWMDDIREMAQRIIDGKGGTKRELKRLMDKLPGLEHIVAILLERGDPHGRAMALHIASEAGLPALRDFVLGRWGTDDERMKASQTATELGLLPRGQSVMMYSKGEPRELLLFSYEISEEPEPSKIPKAAQRLLEETHAALSDGEAEQAFQMAERGLKLVPNNPTFLNYLASAYEMLGEREEADAVVRHTAALHPDYTFARTAMSKLCVQEKKLDEAAEWLEPLMQRSKFHISEFRAFCDAQINLMVARGEREGAQSWVRIWTQVDPDGQFDMLLRRYLR